MRVFLSVLSAVACSILPQLQAQTRSEPSIVLTILGGTAFGHSLWQVPKQTICFGATSCTGQYDTVRLSRSITSSLVLGAAGTYFVSPHVGVHVELSYLGLPRDSACSPEFLNPDTESRNEQICRDIDSQAGGGGAMSIFAGVTLRALSRGWLSPYVRGNVGMLIQSHSTVEVVGGYSDANGTFFDRQIIADQKPHRLSPILGAAAGVTTSLSPGYQIRVEVRDLLASLDRVTGPANSLAIAPTATKTYHHVAFTVGFDVVLEKKSGRRY
jgi:hypothetical protein